MEYYIKQLKSGNVVAFPTETVYGLGADARNPSGIKKIFQLKGRPTDNPLIVHISDLSDVEGFALEIPAPARSLMQKFWPGPLTLIFKKQPKVLDLITAGMDTVAIRMPDHKTAQKLIRRAGPLVAPSANKSGRPSPTTSDHIRADFGDDLPVVEDKPTRIGIESTVLDVTVEPYRILRPGAITRKQLQATIDIPVILHQNKNRKSEQAPQSPGMKYTHYSPRAEVRWLSNNETEISANVLYLLHSGTHPVSERNTPAIKSSRIICYNRDYEKCARELYDRFRQADQEQMQEVAVETFTDKTLENEQITIALENRISKAIGRQQ